MDSIDRFRLALHRRSSAWLVAWLVCVATAVRADEKPAPASRTEFGALSLLGGDSDLGFGGGALASLTRLEAGFTPYRWRAELGGVVTFKPPASDGWRVPYQDAYVLTIPNVLPDQLRLELRPSYTREHNQSYNGIGNAVRAPEPASDEYFQYGRLHPTLSVRIRLALDSQQFAGIGKKLRAAGSLSLRWSAGCTRSIAVHSRQQIDVVCQRRNWN